MHTNLIELKMKSFARIFRMWRLINKQKAAYGCYKKSGLKVMSLGPLSVRFMRLI